jgi:hypothetical protein
MEQESSLPCWHRPAIIVPFLNQINPVHTTPSYFSKIHFNIILCCNINFCPNIIDLFCLKLIALIHAKLKNNSKSLN